MKKVLLSMSLILTLPLVAMAGPRSLEEMKAAASKVIPVAKTRSSANAADGLKVLKTVPQLTVLGYENGGYAVIANDDRFPAVLGYSDSKLSNGDNPGLQWWMNAMSEALAAQAAGKTKAATRVIPDGLKSEVPGLMTTKWGQSAPYYNMCPTYINTSTGASTHYLTGCVATAISQIMYYHKWPETGEGYSSYTFTDANGKVQSLEADYDRAHYDYANMLPVYEEGKYTLIQANAVATIMAHVGISVEMNYQVGASGALHNVACLSLRNYFRYNDNIKMYMRDYYPQQEWMDIVYRELSDGCPVLYGGQAEEFGGHSFVIDGYDADGLVRVNWGWEGSDDGFYDISLLNPPSANYNSFLSQNMVVVRPETDERYNPGYFSMWSLTRALEMGTDGSQLTFSQISAANLDVESFYGDILLVAENMSTGERTVLRTLNSYSASRAVEYGEIEFFGQKDPVSVEALADGEYRIFVASQSPLEATMQPMRSHETVNNSYILTKSGSTLSLTAENNPNWTATTGISGVEVGDSTGDGIVRVYDMSGRMVYSAPAAGFSVADVPAEGVLIIKNGSQVKKVIK